MSAFDTVHEIQDPGPYVLSKKLKALFIILLLGGALSLAFLFVVDARRGWSIFLINHFYFLCLALGGAFFAVIQWLTSAMWSAPIRRMNESFTAYLPIAGLTLVGVFGGVLSGQIYEWTHHEVVQADTVLQHKAGYLNQTFFIIRNVLVFGLLAYFIKKVIGHSTRQDQSKDVGLTLANKALAPAFLIVFALGFTMMSFDQMMSLEPHWFSTIFGIYCFAGLFTSTLAMTCLLTLKLRREGPLSKIVTDDHLHDLGKFMFAFTVFWAYIGFSQFMLIWYANLPEETSYYLHRMEGGWKWVSYGLMLKFVIPFFSLLPRSAKRSPGRLRWVAWFMLIAQFVDIFWMVQPTFFAEGPRFGIFEVAVTLGFGSLFGLAIFKFLGKHSVVAVGDPRLQEAMHHHQ